MIVDRLTKSAHFLPFQMSDGVDKCVELYMTVIVKLHGAHVSIVSDRDPRFTLNFWMVFQKALGTKVHMSTTYHPQTEGQSERTIQSLEDLLEACIVDWSKLWEKHLPLSEFVYNNNYHPSIGM